MLESSSIRVSIAIDLRAITTALSRYYLGLWLTQSINVDFPIGTLIVNLSGCLFMGLITTLVVRRLTLW